MNKNEQKVCIIIDLLRQTLTAVDNEPVEVRLAALLGLAAWTAQQGNISKEKVMFSLGATFDAFSTTIETLN